MAVARARIRSRTRPPSERAFELARGVRLGGTNIACDALGLAGELIFLSSVLALGPVGRGLRRLPRKSFGRQEVLATEATLSLLGAAGTRLRKHALPAVFGRPFTLGDLRVELYPSGHLPGSASLFVDRGGLDTGGNVRRLLYAGAVRPGRPSFGAAPGELRPADAICIDGTFGHPRFSLPDPEEALAAAVAFVEDCRARGAAPILLTPPFGTAVDVGVQLAGAGIALRGHRSIVAAAAAYRQPGVLSAPTAAVPSILRFTGKLGPDEALLWPPEARSAPLLGRLERPRFAYVSGFSLDPQALAELRADVGIPLSNQAGYRDLVAYVEACGAREVAVHRGQAEELAADLRDRGMDAYVLGPPRQLDLFSA